MSSSSAARGAIAPSALERRYPEAHLPARRALVAQATPATALPAFAQAVGGPDIWMKDDRLSAPEYGGNKPRKLEYWLAGALDAGYRRIITMGGLGSNHCLATTIHARRFELGVTLILGPQPMADKDRRNLMANHALGAEIVAVDRYDQVGAILRSLNYRYQKKDGREPFLIPAGGSGPLGALGFVSAFFELVEQIDAGLLPRPERVYLPVGTCGTLAGLLLGARLAECPVRFVGVQVTPDNVASRDKVVEMANQTARLLRRSGAPVPADLVIHADDFDLETRFLGDGYAAPTEAGTAAVDLLADREGILLEHTYTGKALAALIDHVRAGLCDKPVLFWNTFNGADFWSPLSDQVSPQSLPEYLRLRLENRKPQ